MLYYFYMKDEDFAKIFAERLKELRKEQGLTGEQLAKAIGVSKMAISFWERGERIPNMLALVALANFFGVTVDYLCGLED